MLMVATGAVGTNHDFYARNAANQVWNGSAFVPFNAADYLLYRIAATPDGSGDFTAEAPPGTYRFELRVRGASLAASYIVYKDKVDLIGKVGSQIRW